MSAGLGREYHYADFQVPMERRGRRFREGIEIIEELWTQPKVDYPVGRFAQQVEALAEVVDLA